VIGKIESWYQVLASSMSVLLPAAFPHPPVSIDDTYFEESHAALAVAVFAEDSGHDDERGKGALCVCEYVCVCAGGGGRESSVLVAICC